MSKRKDRNLLVHSIRFRQIVILMAVLVFNLICCFLFYKEASNNSRKAVYDRMEDQASYYLDSIDKQIDGIVQQCANFYRDRKLSYIADSRISVGNYDWREAILSVQDRLFALESANTLVENVTLYAPRGGYVLTSYQAEHFEDTDELEYQKLCKSMEEDDNFFSYEEDEIYFCITQSKYNPRIEPTFILKIELNKGLIEQQLNQLSTGEGGSFLYQPNVDVNANVHDEAAEAVLTAMKEMIHCDNGYSGEIMRLNTDGNTYLTCSSHSFYFGWLIQYELERTVLQQLRSYRRWFVLFLVASVGVILLFTGYTDRMINRPLKRLNEAFHVLQEGNTEVKLSHSSKDEFEYIYKAFNQMTERLHRLIDEVYIQKNMAQKAELKQLQSQINPHFLYNSFFLLSSRIKRGDMEGAEEFADYLGVYFRFLTRNTSATVPLEKEVEHAVAYAKIQAARFAARIQVQIEELPENAKNIIVPRLIIQPFLENAFKHGLEDKEEDGILSISYCNTDTECHICIENNGNISEEELEGIKESLKADYTGEVTGLVNIHRRLVIYYKEKGGIVVSRGKSGGLCVEIVLPLEQINE